MKAFISLLVFTFSLSILTANAGVIIEANYDANHTVFPDDGATIFTGGGTIDLNSTLGRSHWSSQDIAVNSQDGYLGIHGYNPSYFYSITNVSFSGEFGHYKDLDDSTGDGAFANSRFFFTNMNYYSGNLLTIRAYISGSSLFDLGHTDGAFTRVDWSNNGVSEFIQINWNDVSQVPEPSIIALLGIGILGLGLSRRKMKK